jgi:hypothetical protein
VIQKLKTVMGYAYDEDKHTNLEFKKNYFSKVTEVINHPYLNQDELLRIENLVLKFKISFIDTSANYGNSEKIIGNSKLKKLNIITKFKLPNQKIDIKNWVEEIEESIKSQTKFCKPILI